MLRISLVTMSMLAACTPSPQKAAMPNPSPASATPVTGNPVEGPSAASLQGDASRANGSTGPAIGSPQAAATAPVTQPVTIVGSLAPAPIADSPAAALGRRIVSTAFVRVGPDGHLTVELHDGRVLVLRDVVMGPKDYCGVRLSAGSGHVRYCGGYADVAAARPGGAPAPGQPDLAASNP